MTFHHLHFYIPDKLQQISLFNNPHHFEMLNKNIWLFLQLNRSLNIPQTKPPQFSTYSTQNFLPWDHFTILKNFTTALCGCFFHDMTLKNYDTNFSTDTITTTNKYSYLIFIIVFSYLIFYPYLNLHSAEGKAGWKLRLLTSYKRRKTYNEVHMQ